MTRATLSLPALVVAPHPDDETIGCGGTIRRKTLAGCAVTVVIAADGGDTTRRAECIEACRRLGVPEASVIFLGFPDGDLAGHRAELQVRLRSLLAELRPSEVFGPAAVDNHADHRTLAEATRDACSASGQPALYEYPVWFWNRYAWVDRGTPVWRQRGQLLWRPLRFTLTTKVRKVDIVPVNHDKREALNAHVSQVGGAGTSTGHEVLDPEWLETFLGADEVFFGHRSPRFRRNR